MSAFATAAKSSDYNPIAGFYRKHWCGHYHAGLTTMLDRLLLADLPKGARVLDLCCGTGAIARHVVTRGFAVTGVDASEEMLRYARHEVPEGEFLVADAESFRLPPVFDAALSTFDSVSYLLDRKSLELTFSNVHAALRPGAWFVFDLSVEEAYKNEWGQSCTIVEADEVCIVRGSYDERERLGRTFITTFQRNGGWERTDVEFLVRSHSPQEVLSALARAGFADTMCHLSDEDEVLGRELGPRRACFVAKKESGVTHNSVQTDIDCT
jgi:SAM-dependent methyltransferase